MIVCGLEMKCDFLIEIEGFEFLRGSNARLTEDNLCAVGRLCLRLALTLVGTNPLMRISNVGFVCLNASCVCVES